MPSRRSRLREATVQDIKAAALERLRDHGVEGLALRAIARDVGMSAPGLYRYFDSRDDLLTALITDGYHDLANHLHAATGSDDFIEIDRPVPVKDLPRASPDDPPGVRLEVAGLAYRRWAVLRPHEFGLLFGTPVPGYAAPPGGPTVVAMGRVGQAFLEPLVAAALGGQLRCHDPEALSASTRRAVAGMYEAVPPSVPAEALTTMLGAWGHLHGLVCLEAFGHWAWLLEDAEDIVRAELRQLRTSLGL